MMRATALLEPMTMLLGAACVSLALAAPVRARADTVQLEGHTFPATSIVQGERLILNGAGPVDTTGPKAIVLGLYLPQSATTAKQVAALKGPKRIQFYFVRAASSRDTYDALLERMRENVSRVDFNAHIMATAQLGSVFGSRARFQPGDEIRIDYVAATRSTEFYLNKLKLGDTIQGEAFYSMMLKVFLGPKVRERDALLLGRLPA